MAAHLIAYALQWTYTDGPIDVAQVQEICDHLIGPSGSANGITDRDLAILQTAVYLNPARSLISNRTLATLIRAWNRLGWTWQWPGDPEGTDLDGGMSVIQGAEDHIRALIHGWDWPPAPPAEHGPEEPGDVECTDCGRMFWSVDGHPRIVLCSRCWKGESTATERMPRQMVDIRAVRRHLAPVAACGNCGRELGFHTVAQLSTCNRAELKIPTLAPPAQKSTVPSRDESAPDLEFGPPPPKSTLPGYEHEFGGADLAWDRASEKFPPDAFWAGPVPVRRDVD